MSTLLTIVQSGKCAVTGQKFANTSEIHCHHKVPKHMSGTDYYENLALVRQDIYKLIHDNTKEMIEKYKTICDLNKEQMKKLIFFVNLLDTQKLLKLE